MARQKEDKKKIYEVQVQQELAGIVKDELSHEFSGFFSITKVELNKDYSHANVYWDTFNVEKRTFIEKLLQSHRANLRKRLALVLKVHHIPDLHFHYDKQYEAEQSIMDIINKDKVDPK